MPSEMQEPHFEYLDRGDGLRLAFESKPGAGPTLVWLSGFRSDMGGTKAAALAHWAEEKDQSFLRLDYSGHGRSEGHFEDGTIGRWKDDALAIIDAKTNGPLVLIGSSMGGWIALLIARERPERVKGMLLLAPAPDFTERLIWPELSPKAQRQILANGRWDMPSEYDPEPTPITRALIEDGKKHLVLPGPIQFEGPVHVMHGQNDPDVPRWLVVDLFDALTTDNKLFSHIGGGDHRLSRPQDIEKMLDHAEGLAREIARREVREQS